MGKLLVKRSISHRLTQYLVLSFIIPFVLAAFYISSFFRSAMEGQEFRHSTALLDHIGMYLEDSVLLEMESLLRTISADARILRADQALTDYTAFDPVAFVDDPTAVEMDIQAYLKNIKDAYPNVSFLFMGTDDGGYLEYPDFKPTQPYDPRVRPWYQNAYTSDEVVVSNPYRTQVSQELVISITRRITLNSGRRAVVGMTVNLDRLGELAARQTASHGIQSLMILDQSGHLIVSDLAREWILKTPEEAGLTAVVSALDKPGQLMVGEVDGEKYQINSTLTPKYGWWVVSLRRLSDIEDSVQKITVIVGIIIISFLMIALLLMRLSIVGITGSLREIAEAIFRVDEPEYNPSMELNRIGTRQDEVGLISRAVNELIIALKQVAHPDSGKFEGLTMIERPAAYPSGVEYLTNQALAHTRMDQELIASVSEQLSLSEHQLLRSQTQLQAAYEIANDAFFEWTPEPGGLYLNPRFYELLALEPQNYDGEYQTLLQMVHPDDAEVFDTTFQSLISGRQEHYSLIFRVLTRQGGILWFSGKGQIMERGPEGTALRIMGLNTDITEQKLVEAQLRRINEDLEGLVAERTQELMAMNEELQAMNEEVLDVNLSLHREVDERKQAEQALVTMNQELSTALEHLRAAQKQLLHSEKMASLGVLVTGVAHEVNTPIGIGVTAASYLKQLNTEALKLLASGALSPEALREYADDSSEAASIILTNLERAAALISSFKNISVDQSSELCRNFNVKHYIQEIMQSLHPQIKRLKLEVHLECPPELSFFSYPGAFSQIVTNLVLNAVKHGFHDRDHGRIEIWGESVGGALKLVFTDDGVGMEEDVASRIFDPFFTTKRGSGGSGLGLFIVHNLVEQQFGGTISCISHPGKGTRFELVLHPAEPETAS